MKALLKHSGWFSLILALPALFLCTAGILYSGFGFAEVNKSLEELMTNPIGKVLFSPAVVLGGVLLVIALNLPKVCRVSAQVDHSEFSVGTVIKLSLGHLIPLALAGTLLLLLLAYGFVENFKIVAR